MKSLRIALIIALMAVPQAANADLVGQLDDMLNSMSNTTNPGVYESRTRGIISGGAVTMRTNITDTNLASFVAPNWSAGCGGIDFYSGSFSFINAEQFETLMRNVASNAAGYAFQIALDVTCPVCKQTIDTLQKKIQELNQYFGNSCQLAKGIVNDVKSAVTGAENNQASLIATASGFVDDMFSAATSDPMTTLFQNDPSTASEEFLGNLVWKALKNNNANNSFARGDDDLLQSIMSVTGTVIINKEDTNGTITLRKTFVEPTISVRDMMMSSGSLRVLSCNGDTTNCMEPTLKTKTDYVGLVDKVQSKLVGDCSATGTGSGVIYKLAYNIKPTTEEQNLIASMNGIVGVALINMAKHNCAAAQTAAYQAAPLIALDMATTLVNDMIYVTQNAATGVNNIHSDQLAAKLVEVRRGVQAEWQRIVTENGRPAEFAAEYYNMIGFTRKLQAGIRQR